MLFNTLAYARFFVLVFLISWGLARFRKLRVAFLLAASYAFYAHWDWRFLGLIFGSSTIDWWLGNRIARSSEPKTRKLWLLSTVVVNLGVLGFFKYWNFGIDTARTVLEGLGLHPSLSTLQVALPVGISFFTFESMSYVIDVYRRDIEPHPSYLEYLCFVAFFPHLVAGPIVRPRDLLPQLANPAQFIPERASEGLLLIAIGLLKKVAIGDYLALNLVDRAFGSPLYYSSLECYAAIVGYAVQIYCDFSGYTDIAIGSALLLGIRFPQNFASPYQASNIQDFWRRWHISLSTWLRDYLYVPLGGNRKGNARTYVNLMLTMLIGGLWHGASWTFVIWGGLHGVALAFTRAWQRRFGTAMQPNTRITISRILGVFFTFHFVCLCWIFFRAGSFGKVSLMLSQLSQLTTHHPNLNPMLLAVLGVGMATHYVPEGSFERLKQRYIAAPALVQGVLLFAAALIVRKMMSAETVPFVYFQF
jgi:D-alanyl-lipoteichoic acid acyltransferase DltB (MBOAT superfamily)